MKTILYPCSGSDEAHPDAIFSTERMQLAIYLHATRLIAFLRCEQGQSGKIRFLFDDPAHDGSRIELEFDRGAEVAATKLFASQKFLRRSMSEASQHTETRKIQYETIYNRPSK